MSFDQLGKARLKSFSDLVRYLEYKLLGPETGEGEGDRGWTARQAKGTLEAFVRRLRSSVENVAHLVRGDRPGSPPDPFRGRPRCTWWTWPSSPPGADVRGGKPPQGPL